VFRNLLLGKDSFAGIRCNGTVISESSLSNGRLALAPLFRHSAVKSQYLLLYSYPSLSLPSNKSTKACKTGPDKILHGSLEV
jgi:hypothetical protein